MTNKEIIKYLIAPVATSTEPSAEYLKQKEAYDLAIKALEEQRPKGMWIHRRVIAKNRSFDMVVCSNCWEEFSWDAETGVSMDNYETCPNCAADMRENNNVSSKYNSSINTSMEDIMSNPELYKHWIEISR